MERIGLYLSQGQGDHHMWGHVTVRWMEESLVSDKDTSSWRIYILLGVLAICIGGIEPFVAVC
ncbi:MAG: hypothetical protein CL920_00365 [Deltaproteobacteria bacterium]|nr:hypothetical protein [Deltaproteobacteria bacterium]